MRKESGQEGGEVPEGATDPKRSRMTTSDKIGVAAVLVTLLGASVFTWWNTSLELRAMQDLSSRQHEQVIEQLRAQQQFAQALQEQQHLLVLRQMDAQDKFALGQIEFQKSLEEAWEQRRINDARVASCQENTRRRRDQELALLSELVDAISSIDESQNNDAHHAYLEAVLSVRMSNQQWMDVEHAWNVMKDLQELNVSSEGWRAKHSAARARLQVVLVAISAAYPAHVRQLAQDVNRAIPRPARELQQFAEVVKLETQQVDEYPGAAEFRKSALRLAQEALVGKRNQDNLNFVTARGALQDSMYAHLIAPEPKCT